MADFGQNEDAVLSFLDRIAALDEGDALALAAAWEAADDRRRRLAWRAVRHAARDGGRVRALGDAQSAIVSWSNSWSPVMFTLGAGIGGQYQADATRRAVPALVDAVSALVVGGLIDGPDFEALYGPWRSVDEGASEP